MSITQSDFDIGQNFVWRHADVLSCKRLKSGLWSVRLRDGTPWPPAGHGDTPDLAYEAAKLDRITRKLER